MLSACDCNCPLGLHSAIFALFSIFFLLFNSQIFVVQYFFTLLSGRGLEIPIFFRVFFLPAVFIWQNKYLVVSFATQARACILSDHNIFYTPRGWRAMAGFNAPRTFPVLVYLL